MSDQLFTFSEVSVESTVSIVGVPPESRFFDMFRKFEEQSANLVDPDQIHDYETAEYLMEVLIQFAIEQGEMEEDEPEGVPFIIDNVIKVKDTSSIIITVVDVELSEQETDDSEQWELES